MTSENDEEKKTSTKIKYQIITDDFLPTNPSRNDHIQLFFFVTRRESDEKGGFRENRNGFLIIF